MTELTHPSQAEASSQSQLPVSRHGPADLMTLAVEVRLNIYDHLFGHKVAVMRENPLPSSHLGNPASLVYGNPETIYPTQRSAQILRVCRQIYHEACSRLYTNTTFYVHGDIHLASLPRYVDGHNLRILVLRRKVVDFSGRHYKDCVTQALDLDEITFPNLKSLEIIIGWSAKIDPDSYDRMKVKSFKKEVLLSLFRIQSSHNHLCGIFESGITTGNGFTFRLVTASAKGRENVSSPISRPKFH